MNEVANFMLKVALVLLVIFLYFLGIVLLQTHFYNEKKKETCLYNCGVILDNPMSGDIKFN